jgi:hypothetical protein
MSYLIDDVARTLASPISRRKAFRLILGVLAGGFMATVGIQKAQAFACDCFTTGCHEGSGGNACSSCCGGAGSGMCCCKGTGVCISSTNANGGNCANNLPNTGC